jgi:PAS domain S-box-containing protein
MKNLKTFAAFLKNEKLTPYSQDSIALAKEMNIPVMKLFKDLSEEQLLHMSMNTNLHFLDSLIDDTALQNAGTNLKLWEENKMPGISRTDIQPSDLVLAYALQKKIMLTYLSQYTSSASEAILIMMELENYYTTVQEAAVKVFFKIQKETENLLRESEDRYKDLFENTNDFIHILNLEGNIQYVNKSWISGMGYSSEEVINTSIKRFIHPDFLERYTIADHKAVTEQTTELIEIILVAKNGTPLTVEGSINYKFLDKEPLFSRGIFRNITQRKAVEEELSNKTKELIRSNSELEQFAYVASHDLQEPLRMINSYIQLLASRYKDQLDQDANDFIDFAVDGSNRMRILINSLLEYSRVNRIKPFQYINVQEILSEVLMDMDRSIRENSAIIQYSKLPDIYCDPVLMGLLFQNLIGNAIKFKGGESPVISISAERKGGHHLFAIKDNGIGIPKQYFDKIFVIFQRLNTVDKYPGTGIGLAICKKIVERHGGEIWVTSEPGGGAVFYFTIK